MLTPYIQRRCRCFLPCHLTIQSDSIRRWAGCLLLIACSSSFPLRGQDFSTIPSEDNSTVSIETDTSQQGSIITLHQAPTTASAGDRCDSGYTVLALMAGKPDTVQPGKLTTLYLDKPLSANAKICTIFKSATDENIVASGKVAIVTQKAKPPVFNLVPSEGEPTLSIASDPSLAGDDIVLYLAPATATATDDCASSDTVVPLKAGTSATVQPDKPTTLTPDKPLPANAKICVIIKSAKNGDVVATGKVTVVKQNATPPVFTPIPSEGEPTVSIATEPSQEGDEIVLYLAPATATATDDCASSDSVVPLKAGTSATVQSGKLTTLTLDKSLSANAKICVIIKSAKGGDVVATGKVATVAQPIAPPGFDWGLVRAYFTLGALGSQERDQFSHQDLFLSFRIDKTYKMLDNHDAADGHSWKPGLNTFFETRLTAVPVAVQNCTPTAATPCSNSNTSSDTTPPPTTQVFLNSQKSARLLFGLYVPLMLNRWNVPAREASGTRNVPYALYIAPLIKTGFDTTVNGLNQTQQQSSTPPHVQSVGGSSQFYKFYDFGFRLGHYKLSDSDSVAPTQLSFLDVTWGRFSNLASLLCPAAQYQGNNTCAAASSDATSPPVLPWQRDFRMNVEGLLEVPGARGFSIGFSTNVSFYKNGKSAGAGGPVHIQPADDLRFLFAYKFDIGKIAAKLSPGFSD